MQRIPDRSGLLGRRPTYTPAEIDAICEERIEAFLRMKYGTIGYPISTDDLTILIEQDVDYLDLYADLSIFDGAVDGLTLFSAGALPRVHIAAALSLDPDLELRQRAVLAHELGHVLLHSALGELAALTSTQCPVEICDPADGQHDRGTASTNWMEWQAHLASAALLMPATAVDETVRQIWPEGAFCSPVCAGSLSAIHLIDEVQRCFHVSPTAARDRLLQLSYLALG
jgi:hypothetical protein